MKKWIFIIALSACCTAVVSFMKVDVTAEKQIIYIKSGEPVIADHVSKSDQFIFYESDGQSGMFMKNDVASVGSIAVEKQISLTQIVEQWKDRVIKKRTGWDIVGKKMFDSRILFFFAILAVISLLFKLFQVFFRWIETIGFTKKEEKAHIGPVGEANHKQDEILVNSDLRDIALFFLELFKVQNGLGKDAPARYQMTDHASSRKMKIFELSVMSGREWLTRRMSIGPLGEDTGSKSKCFYAIYDTHMVIKVPPVPVTDMGTYVKAIRKEGKISSQLSPVACIVPMITVVLKKVTTLPYASSLTQAQLEKQYIRLVEEKPDYQEYLKIGGRFAFFMELTNNIFLARVIDEIHAFKNKIGDEIREVPDVAWDQEAFTTRYGLGSLTVFNNLQTLYRLCETEVKRTIHASNKKVNIHTFQIKNWFLSRIAGEPLDRAEKEIGEDLIIRIEDDFTRIFESNKQIVNDLLQLLKSQLATKVFVQYRHQIENVSSNMLQLLCRLKERKIALRDLKPDNLFMDANPDHYPGFLNDRAAFSIGVIDVETAVSLDSAKDGRIEQPILGGTPLYATPLHLLKNEILASCFTNLSDVHYFQDWYAVIANIFRVTTGKNLFVRASRSFPVALRMIKQSRSKAAPDEKTVKAMSEKFWSAALADMKKGLAVFSDELNQLTLIVPDAMVPEFEKELRREQKCLERAIRRHVSVSPLVKNEKNKAFLIEASSEEIQKQIAKWESSEGLSEQHSHLAPKMVAFLRNLNRMKMSKAEKISMLLTLTSAGRQISAFSLLEAMFQIAYRVMYTSQWNTIPQPDSSSNRQAAVTEDSSMITTLLSDHKA